MRYEGTNVSIADRQYNDDDYEHKLGVYRIADRNPKLYSYMLKMREIYQSKNRHRKDRAYLTVRDGKTQGYYSIERMIPVMYEQMFFGEEIPYGDEQSYL